MITNKMALLQKELCFINYTAVNSCDLFYIADTDCFIIWDFGKLTSIHVSII